jgi:signal transduction histidine kinase
MERPPQASASQRLVDRWVDLTSWLRVATTMLLCLAALPRAWRGREVEEFRQVGNAWTRKQEGPGLGLALARRFVALHGGELWVESALGVGSEFRFTIPREMPAAQAVSGAA